MAFLHHLGFIGVGFFAGTVEVAGALLFEMIGDCVLPVLPISRCF